MLGLAMPALGAFQVGWVPLEDSDEGIMGSDSEH